MGLISKTVLMRWHTANKKFYEAKGYIYTKMKDEFKVRIEDLPNGSVTLVDIRCDGCCEILKDISWQNYLKCLHENGKYYCRKCALKLYGNENYRITRLKNGKSFKQWCTDNNRQDILDRWDYELNNCKPSEIGYGTTKKYYFRCPKGLHESELKRIGDLTSGKSNLVCIQCSSFEQWCLNNNSKDALDRWDYKLNDKKPNEMGRSARGKYWFKCPQGLHKSELKSINSFTKESEGTLDCNACNSIAQWGYDSIDDKFLEKYWDYEKNNELGIDPWGIAKCSNKKVYIKCQEKNYHGSYPVQCNGFVSMNSRCPYCTNYHGKVHSLDSLGTLYPQVLKIWSSKNKKSSYEYAPHSGQYIWWKCPDGKHEDYYRSVSDSNISDFRCPSCQFSKGEKRIEDYLIKNNFIKISEEQYNNLEISNKNNKYYIPQKTYEGLLGLGNGTLSYDFYLLNYNLLIEYQGGQHEKFTKGIHKSKKDFEKQVEHDRRKKEYAKQNNIKLLEIWYWDYDNIEEILDMELSIKK